MDYVSKFKYFAQGTNEPTEQFYMLNDMEQLEALDQLWSIVEVDGEEYTGTFTLAEIDDLYDEIEKEVLEGAE